jgi:hypothetical protein
MKGLRGIGLGTLALAFVSEAEAKVNPAPIAELIRSADVIVLAKVVSVGGGAATRKRNSKGAVAVAEAVESWKGDVGTTVRFSIEKTWSCDVSGAVVGERAVLILNKKDSERVRVVPGVHFLSFSGRGRMPIVERDGKSFVRVQGEVDLPGDLESTKAPEFLGDNLVGLDAFRAYVRTLATTNAVQTGVAPDDRSPAAPARGLTPRR